MERKIINTKDNSKTLLIPEMNETYHSTNGAIAESKHIYIKHGLSTITPSKCIKIFEMGFGTGLNTLLTMDIAQKSNQNIFYHTIEKYPITISEIKVLDYATTANLKNLENNYNKLHQVKTDETHKISESFEFLKQHIDLKTINLKDTFYDIIYFDAFAPKHQPNLWTVEVLQKMYKCLKPNGFLITYCAQGQFKRNLKSVGFEVTPLPGPIGKREITKAIKI